MTLFVETLRLIRERARREHDLRRVEHVVRAAGAAHARRRVPRDRAEPRPDERDHGRALARDASRRCGRRDFLLGRDEWGAALDRARTARSRRRPRRERAEAVPESRRIRTASGCASSQVARTRVKEARVPAGTTLFDAASWNGIAIDSTCGGHGTCKKCKVRVVVGRRADLDRSIRARSRPDELQDGWRLACRAAAHEDLSIEVPPLQTRPKAALAGVGRHVILRPAVQKRYLELDEPTLEDQTSDLERVLAAMDDVELARPARGRAHARPHAPRSRLEGHGGARRRPADRRRAGRHDAAAATRSRSTSARRRSSRRCSTSRRGSRSRCARC